MVILKRLTQCFHFSASGKNLSSSHLRADWETSIARAQPMDAEALSELLQRTSSEREERLSAEGLEEILRYIGNG